MLKRLQKLLHDEHGASAVEYILVLAMIAIALVWFQPDKSDGDKQASSAITTETPRT